MVMRVMASVLNGILSELTPGQRWQSAGRFKGDWMTQRWFIVTAIVVLIILTLLLLVISLYRTAKEKKTANLLFAKNAEKRGLSEGELKMLIDIASSIGARHKMAVFTMEDIFNRGAARIIEKLLAKGAHPAEIERLKRDFSFLREKLRLQHPDPGPSEIITRVQPNKPNTRQIPIGKKILITRRIGRKDDEIESTVINNTDKGLTVKLTKHVRINFGDLWSARYYFDRSVWEFNTSVISYDGRVLVLSHSDNAYYVNRRRFLRVPVRKEALIAPFPFVTKVKRQINGIDKNSNSGGTKENASGCTLVGPEFFPAVVIELAGPGLRIEVPMEIKKGDRVIVIFALYDQESAETRQADKKSSFEIVGDIGEVRHTEAVEYGYSVAVELTGLSDADIDHLVRATNAASISRVDQNQDTTVQAEAGEDILKSKIAQGV
jgi:hypothetical protein